jgi:hypothetical protein
MLRKLICLFAATTTLACALWAEEEKKAEPAAKKVEPAAKFVKTDEKTAGNWKGKYGAEGAIIAADSAKAPKYGTVTPADKEDHTWAETTDEERALKKSAEDAKDRLAACWYRGTGFDIDLNLTDDAEHQVAIYCLDWDTETREMTVEVQNAETGAKLDGQNVKDIHNGKYVVWNVKGHVKLHVTKVGEPNAVVSAVFFDAPEKAK